MGARRFTGRRVRHHVLLGLASGLMVAAVYWLTPPPDWHHRLSMGTAYAGLALLVWTLLLGPVRALRGRVAPASFDMRRDVGIWAGLLALAHTAVGLTVHLRGRMWMYFLKRLHPLKLQNTAFGAANYSGLVAALLFLMLVMISNDVSLRAMGAARWKQWQRWAYVAAALTAVHGLIFQQVEARHLPWRAVLYLGLGITLVLQVAGVVVTARRRD